MRAGGGKSKGASFERKICVALSLWVTEGKREDVFWRSAMSGGRATVRAAKGKSTKAQYGDISSVAKEGHALIDNFVVECKHVRDLNFRAALIRSSGPLVEFWKQVSRDANKADRDPLLIARQNGCPIMVFIAEIALNRILRFNDVVPIAAFHKIDNNNTVCMLTLTDFLKLQPPV